MSSPKISINQLAEFHSATDASKKRIIKNQQSPNKFLLPWYQLPKARIKKCIELRGDKSPIEEAMKLLENKAPQNDRQRIDKQVSIEALERFVTMRLPSVLSDIGEYEIIRPSKKFLMIGEVEIIVAPEVVIKGRLNNQVVYGAVKIHISKNKPFDFTKATYVATTIKKYLEAAVAQENEFVIPDLCICLDVFSGRLVKASTESITFLEIENICNELNRLWDA
ncbi:MAG: hypothetical protein RIC35_21960 [Marinoscillum sp.]